MADIIPTLTDDERTVLMIAAQGNSMMPIARWKPTVENLCSRGLMRMADPWNCYITDEGRKATEATEASIDLEWKDAVGRAQKGEAKHITQQVEEIGRDLSTQEESLRFACENVAKAIISGFDRRDWDRCARSSGQIIEAYLKHELVK